MRCKRNKLTGIVSCFINEIKDYDHSGAKNLEGENPWDESPADIPPVRKKKQPDNVGLHTKV